MTATTLPSLTRTQLSDVDAGAVEVPGSALLELPERIVQFGTGNFLRGFVDDFIHRANRDGRYGGRIVAIGSTGSGRDAGLREQDGLYTLCVAGLEKGEVVEQCRIISSVSRAISARDDWDEVLTLARIADLDFVFSNTTEVGIVADETSLFDDAPPHSFPAKLTRFLFERGREFGYASHKAPIVIPCELIEGNGSALEALVLAIATRWKLDARFSEWIEAAVVFVDTLVDRIVPGSPTAENAERLREVLGYDDGMLTCCEPYSLFAIQGGEGLRARLGWAGGDPNVIVAQDIAPFRKRKVHLLNGAHTLLASLALPLGFETVRDAVSNPLLLEFLRHAMANEIVPVLGVDAGAEFADEVLERFRNPYIRHALVDITLQAVMKMRVRVMPCILDYASRFEKLPPALTFGFAAFLHFMKGEFHEVRKARGLSMPADNQAADLRAHWDLMLSSSSQRVAATEGSAPLSFSSQRVAATEGSAPLSFSSQRVAATEGSAPLSSSRERAAATEGPAPLSSSRERVAATEGPAPLSSSRERVAATEGPARDATANAVHAICADTRLWGTDLSLIPQFRETVSEYVHQIKHDGISKALSTLVELY